eukprot:Hpha_TRINITY_DN15549_c6_g5::TRINITY_DN15549_c6_g5_i1::g.107224::m.107224
MRAAEACGGSGPKKALPPLREAPRGAANRELACGGGYSGLPVAVAAGSVQAETAARCTVGCEEAMRRGELQVWCSTMGRTRLVPALAGPANKRAAPVPVGRGAAALGSSRLWVGHAGTLRATGAERRRREVERLEDGARRGMSSQEQDERWVLVRSHWLRASEKSRKAGPEAAAPDGKVLATRASEAARKKAAGARKVAEAALRIVAGTEQDSRFAIVSEEQRDATRVSLVGLRLEALATVGDVSGTTVGVEADERMGRAAVADVECSLRHGCMSIETQAHVEVLARESERLKVEHTERARVWVEQRDRREAVRAEESCEYASATADWRAAADKLAQALMWTSIRMEAELRFVIEADEAAAWEHDLPSSGSGAAVQADREAREAGIPPLLLLDHSETGYRRLLVREEEADRGDVLGSEWRVTGRRALIAEESAAREQLELDGGAAGAVLLRTASGPAPLSRASTTATTPCDEDELWAALDVALRPESRLSTRSVGSIDPDVEINAARREMLWQHYGCDPERTRAATRIEACWRGYRQWRDFLHRLYSHQLFLLRARLRLRESEAFPPNPGPPSSRASSFVSAPDASGADLWAELDEMWDE